MMKYKSSENNIYSSDNIDPEFIEYLYQLPAQFLEELFMTWAMLKSKEITSKIKVIDIDKIYQPKAISSSEIADFYNFLINDKIDLSKLKGEEK